MARGRQLERYMWCLGGIFTLQVAFVADYNAKRGRAGHEPGINVADEVKS